MLKYQNNSRSARGAAHLHEKVLVLVCWCWCVGGMSTGAARMTPRPSRCRRRYDSRFRVWGLGSPTSYQQVWSQESGELGGQAARGVCRGKQGAAAGTVKKERVQSGSGSAEQEGAGGSVL